MLPGLRCGERDSESIDAQALIALARRPVRAREVMLDRPSSAFEELYTLSQMTSTDVDAPMLREEASALGGIATGNADAFRNALADLLPAHAEWASAVCRGLMTQADLLPPDAPVS